MAGLGAVVLLVTLWVNPTLDAIGGNPNGFPWFGTIYVFSLTWPITVWLRNGSPQRRGVEPLPVGVVAQRLARVAAGAVWLEATVLLTLAGRAASVAGWMPSSTLLARESGSWAGIACGVLLLYLLGSVPHLLAPTHHLAWALGWIAMLIGEIPRAQRIAPNARFSIGTALSTLAPHPGPWVGAVLLWTAVFAAVAAGAAAWGVALERAAPSSARAGRTA
jgi:hypothetical protein